MNDHEIVEWIDPDWRDHFADTDQAAEFYRQYAAEEWRRAEQELSE